MLPAVGTHGTVLLLSSIMFMAFVANLLYSNSGIRKTINGVVFAEVPSIELPATPPHDDRISVPPTPARQATNGELLNIDPKVYSEVGFSTYTVREGDTIWEIASQFGLRPGTLLSVNPIDSVRRLLPGTVLSVPDRDGVMQSVQEGQTVSEIAAENDVSVNSILDANNLRSDLLEIGTTLFIPGATMDEEEYLLAIGELFRWPLVSVRSTSSFGMRRDPFTGVWRMHTGVDLGNPWGNPVLAASSGTVIIADPESGAYGKLVVVDHGNSLQTYYAHMSKILVRRGERVSRGERVGNVGNTGRSTGPHLHFSVTRDGRWEDPLRYVK